MGTGVLGMMFSLTALLCMGWKIVNGGLFDLGCSGRFWKMG